jgi:lipopolysaccharide export system protein LptC
MTDYFYQARVRDDPPEDEGEAPLADAAPRRNPYPPEDEAYWAEAGAAPEAPPEPLWYEDRVGLADGAPPEPSAPPPPREAPLASPVRRDRWRVLGQGTHEPEALASPTAAAEEEAWTEQLESESVAGPAPRGPRPPRGWRPFRAKRAEAEVPAAASAAADEEAWTEQPAVAVAAEEPPSPRRGWRLFRSKRADPEMPAEVSAAADEGSAPYWAEAGASPEATEESLWYEDRVRLADGAPPEPSAPPPRRQVRRDPLPPAMEPEVPLPAAEAEDTQYDARAYWTQPAEEEAGAEPWAEEQAYDDRPVYGREDDSAGWAVGAAAEEEGLMPEARAYAPGASAAVARAAAEAGERNIRFDPTKERGPVYYDNAARHSRHVRLLRIVLPTVAVLSVIGFFAVMSWDADDAGLPALNLSGINFEDREITMDKPHISGFDGTKRAYEIHAAKATQALGNTKVVTLETIEARFALGDNVHANLDAGSGIYDSDTQKLKLMGGIQLDTSNGYKAELEEADVDVEAGNVASDTGVMIEGKEGKITADSIEVLERGKHVFFRGNVKVVYHPAETPEKKEEAGGSADASAPAAAPAPAIIEATPDGST